MKTYIVLLGIWLICGQISLQAQTINGEVNSDDGAVPGAQVLVRAQANGLIKQFTSTSHSGSFSIHVNKEHLPAVLEIKAIGYITWQLPLDSLTQDIIGLNIKLVSQPLELSEVVVKAVRESIAVKEDTVIYNVQAFKDGTERVVEDLLKKLPGVEVKDNGTINFKGKPISKLLLDGDDLFGQNYTIGSKNLDIDVVEEVQAVDKFSRNPLLKGIVDSEEVALNLVLKKGKADLSGNVELGYGASERYQVGATLLRVTNSFKSFVLSKYNNTGLNNSPYNAASDFMARPNATDQRLLLPKLITEGNFQTPLDDVRSRLNSSSYSSFNATYKPFKNFTSKVSIGYYADVLRRSNRVETQFGFEDFNFQTLQLEQLKKMPRLFHGEAEFTYKPSANVLFEYVSHINQYIGQSKIEALDNDQLINTTVLTDDLLISQNLNVTKRVSDQAAVKLSVLYGTNTLPQELLSDQNFAFLPEVEPNTESRQTIRNQKHYFDATGTLHRRLKQNELELAGGVRFSKSNFLSDIGIDRQGNQESIAGVDFANDSRYSAAAPYVKLSYQLKLGKLKLKPGAQLSYLMRRLSDGIIRDEKSDESFLLLPSLSLTYKVSENSMVYATYNFRQEPPLEQRLIRGLVINSYRSVTNNVVSLDLLNTNTAFLGYSLNDFYNLFNLSVNGSYSSQKRGYLLSQDISRNFNQITYFLGDADQESYYLSQSVSKYIPVLQTTFKFDAAQGIFRYQNILNGTEIRNNESRLFSFEFFSKTGFNRKLNFEHKYIYQLTKVYTSDFERDFSRLINKFKILYDPAKHWKLTADLHHFIPDLDNISGAYLFFDVGVNYVLPNQRVTFTLTGMNLTNNQAFKELNVNDYATTTRSTDLIGRYVLLSAIVRLK